jgi:hypothetical protein
LAEDPDHCFQVRSRSGEVNTPLKYPQIILEEELVVENIANSP